MGGPIDDMAVRTCPACRAVWMEDDRMYRDVDRCPRCGTAASDAPQPEDDGGIIDGIES